MRTSTMHLILTLVVLTAINTMNFFDRQILPAVQEKIRAQWDLSDSKLGCWEPRSFCSMPWWACRWGGSRTSADASGFWPSACSYGV